MSTQQKIQKRAYPHRQKSIEGSVLCIHCGSKNCIKGGKHRSSGNQQYRCKSCNRVFIPQIVKLFDINPEDEYQKEIWDCRRLGIDPGKGKQAYTLNFKGISQSWLLKPAKAYIKLTLSTQSFSSALNKLGSLKKFSDFLSEQYPSLEPTQLDRAVIIDFLAYLAAKHSKPTTISHFLCNMRDFLDLCYQNEWLPVIRYLIRKEDYPKRPKALPRYIPEGVMAQLTAYIDDLPEPVMRMTLVIIECGMRVSELLYLKPDCLLQDKAGDWFLRYYQFKMKKELTIPVSREVVRVIQEQRCYIQEHLGDSYEYLFCSSFSGPSGFRPRPKPMIRESFARFLNNLAKKHNICDESGKLWRFQMHQFRHTVGTRMINNGVPQHIIQRYLGHESPEMTATYAFIHDKTMKAEIAKFQGKVINIAGQIVESIAPEVEVADLQWFKRNIQAQALPNGSCALPTISQGCPHANACLTCTHFRTTSEYLSEHKKQLGQIERLIEKAQANGWVRQVEMNETVKNNLKKIIAGLEGKVDGNKS
ncbi:MAG: tyrosine-type recombinase/integrase [Kastovskya adunca ATA6-11-RM4]|jgi:integrase|nr:tyrosine-type recombinase/integrase [Kastovskya adunca ATA6-11-RM4]